MKQDYLEKQDIDFLETIDSVFDTIIFNLDIFVDKKEDNLQEIVKQKIEINFKEDVISFEVAPCHLSILSYLISIVTLHKTFFLPLKGRRSDPSSCNLENNLDWYNENIKLYNELLQDEKAKAIIDYSIIRPSDDKYEIISDISDLFYIMHILESDENLCSLVVSLSKEIPFIFNKLQISPEEFGEQSHRITKYILYLDYVHYDGSMTTWLIDKSKYLESPFLELATSSLDEFRTLFEEAYSNDNIQIGDNVVLNNGFSELKIRKFELSREKISNIIQNLSCLSLYGVLFLKLEFNFSYLNSKIDSNIIDIYRRFYKIMGKGADILPLRRFYRFAFLYYLTIQGKILRKSSNVDKQITLAKWILFVYNYSTKHLEYNFSMFMDKVDALMNIYDSGEIERKLSNEAFEKVKSIFINPKVHEYIEILNKPGKISVSATPQEISSDSKDEKVSVSEEKESSPISYIQDNNSDNYVRVLKSKINNPENQPENKILYECLERLFNYLLSGFEDIKLMPSIGKDTSKELFIYRFSGIRKNDQDINTDEKILWTGSGVLLGYIARCLFSSSTNPPMGITKFASFFKKENGKQFNLPASAKCEKIENKDDYETKRRKKQIHEEFVMAVELLRKCGFINAEYTSKRR